AIGIEPLFSLRPLTCASFYLRTVLSFCCFPPRSGLQRYAFYFQTSKSFFKTYFHNSLSLCLKQPRLLKIFFFLCPFSEAECKGSVCFQTSKLSLKKFFKSRFRRIACCASLSAASSPLATSLRTVPFLLGVQR
ncbi:hypothetical protein, partial [Taibaiella soli]|uniref:hypothetical protein n=1 Tax=Taibaiella soli TaxID=1649169 RepID=UPI001A9CF8DE